MNLTFEAGQTIQCFENEEIMLVNGSSKRAADLTEGDDVEHPVRFNGAALAAKEKES